MTLEGAAALGYDWSDFVVTAIAVEGIFALPADEPIIVSAAPSRDVDVTPDLPR